MRGYIGTHTRMSRAQDRLEAEARRKAAEAEAAEEAAEIAAAAEGLSEGRRWTVRQMMEVLTNPSTRRSGVNRMATQLEIELGMPVTRDGAQAYLEMVQGGGPDA